MVQNILNSRNGKNENVGEDIQKVVQENLTTSGNKKQPHEKELRVIVETTKFTIFVGTYTQSCAFRNANSQVSAAFTAALMRIHRR